MTPLKKTVTNPSMKFDFPKAEQQILEIWSKNKTFATCNMLTARKKPFTFYDGPPFATGLPHYGHILSGTIKDAIGRFYIQNNRRVDRRFGFDCHGLPVEYEIDKLLKIETRSEILAMGIGKYNNSCRDIVLKYADQWEQIVGRLGRWVSFRNGYRTMDRAYMESVWHIFGLLYSKNRIYRGYRVMPFSTKCKTPLSNFEANQNYKDVLDHSIVVEFPLINGIDGESGKASLLAWTTTPWTLPSNCGLVANPDFTYLVFKIQNTGDKKVENKIFVMLESRISSYFKNCQVVKIREILGKKLIGREYEPPFSYFENLREKGFFKIISGDYVSDADGTGIVHCAPGFGEDDYKVFVQNGLINDNDLVPCPVDEDGNFTAEIPEFKNRYVKDCETDIIAKLGDKIIYKSKISHRYPFCWRSDTPLIYKLVPNWFIRVKDLRDDLIRNNEMINWVPSSIKGRFKNWLNDCRDWSISRNRFWGTPIPLWTNHDYSKIICISSIKELEKYAKREIKDLHREFIDDIEIDGLRRVDEVLDCWFESGAMPYAQNYYPEKEIVFDEEYLKDKKYLGREKNFTEEIFSPYDDPLKNKFIFPADFIGEGVDQTRGWFYTLHVISTILFNRPAFKNVIVNGIVLASDGKKMSKRLKNYPDPMEIVEKYGADSLRVYLLSSPVVEAENLKFSEDGVKEVFKKLMIPWLNAINFLNECEKENKKPKDKNLGVGKSEDKNLNDKNLDDKNNESTTNDYHNKNSNIQNTCNKSPSTPLDDWIYYTFNNFYSVIHTDISSYRLNSIFNEASSFIDSLTNWYIRMNRKTMKDGNTSTLKNILIGFSIVMAPFTPFFSEFSYQLLKSGRTIDNVLDFIDHRSGSTEQKDADDVENVNESLKKLQVDDNSTKPDIPLFSSVHFQQHPMPIKSTSHPFDIARELIESIRNLREINRISLKTPLWKATVITEKNSLFSDYVGLIKRECNLADVEFKSEDDYEFSEVIKPDFNEIKRSVESDLCRTVGMCGTSDLCGTSDNTDKNVKILSKNMMKNKIGLINKLNTDLEFKNTYLKKILKTGSAEVDGMIIRRPELIYKKQIIGISEGFKSCPDFSVILDMKVTEDLLQKKKEREVFSFVQKLRKRGNLKVEDDVVVSADNSEVISILKKMGVKVKDEKCKEYVFVIGDSCCLEDNYIKVGVYKKRAD